MNFIANIWPIAVADGYTNTIINELKKEGTILSIHEIHLNYTGLRNYMIQIYRHEKWSGNFSNHFRGIPAKLNPCYHPDTPMYLIELEGKSVESLLACKERIRTLCKHEKHSLHTSDTEDEYLLMKKILLHAPTVELMNQVDFDKDSYFTRHFSRFIKTLDFYKFNYNDFLILSPLIISDNANDKNQKFNWTCKVPHRIPRMMEWLNGKQSSDVHNDKYIDIFNTENHISYCGIDFLCPNL